MTSEAEIEAAVDEVGDLLDVRIGLRPQSTLRGRLRRSIRDEASVSGDGLEGYVERLSHSGGMLQSLVNRVTVQESGFFRHPDHFEVLATEIFPALTPPVTLWSAGCANGQEAYSLAMLLEEQGIDGSILATDLSTSALARTAAATYHTREITGLSLLRRQRHLTQHGDEWTVKASLRSRVTTLQHNLLDDVPARVSACKVVFCRNVLIYFSADHSTAFLDKVASVLTPGAYLFLGSAESLWHVADRFEAVRLGESFAYRRRSQPVRRVDVAEAATRGPARTLSRRQRPPLVAGGPRRRVQTPASPTPRTPAVELPEIDVLAATGRRALDAADSASAVVAFRKWTYLAPDDPLANLHLALALEAGGHHAAARRAFGVARAAVLRGGGVSIDATELGGYSPAELVRLLESKQVRER